MHSSQFTPMEGPSNLQWLPRHKMANMSFQVHLHALGPCLSFTVDVTHVSPGPLGLF